jgi:hypothetical protein
VVMCSTLLDVIDHNEKKNLVSISDWYGRNHM